MTDGLESLTPSLVVLSVPAAIALFLTLTRSWADERRVHAAVPLTVVTIVQAAHLAGPVRAGKRPLSGIRAAWQIRPLNQYQLSWLRCQGASSKKASTEATHMTRLARQGGEAGVCCSTLRVARSVGT